MFFAPINTCQFRIEEQEQKHVGPHAKRSLLLSDSNYNWNASINFKGKYPNIKVHEGRAIAQAVSRRLPTAAARVQTRIWSCEIL
jgi:hypothetical protein